MWETGSPARRRANRACAARAVDESIASSPWEMSRTRSQPRTEQSNNSASNRGNPDSHSKPPVVAPVSTAFTPGSASALIGEHGELLGLVLGEQRLSQLGQIAVHDVVDLVEGETDAVVGDPSLRKVISADALGAVPRTDQGLARGGFLGLVLGAPVLAFHDDAGRQMRHSHGGVGLVDVLAARARGAVGVDSKIRGIQYDVTDCARLGQHRYRASRRVNAALGLRSGDSLDAVAAGFEFEPGVRALPDDAGDDLLVAPDIPRRFGYHLHLPTLALRVARIHTEQVTSEERRFVSSGSGTDLEEDIALIVRILRQEQLLQLRFERGEPLAAGLDFAFGVSLHLRIGEQLLRFGDVLFGIAVSIEEFDDGLELRVLPREPAKLFHVTCRVLRGKQRADVDQPLALLIELCRDAGLHRITTAPKLVARAELVQPCHERLERLVLLAALVERLGGSVHQFVGKAVRKRFKHRFWIVAPGEHPHRTLDFTAARVLGGFAKLADERHHFTRLHPVQEGPDLRLDDHLGLSDCRLTGVDALTHRRREVIDGIEKYVVHLRHLALDVPGHGEVDHEDRTVAASANGALHRALADDRQRARGTGNDDVVFRQALGQVAQLDRLRVETARKGFGPFQRAVRHRHAARLLRGEMSRGKLDHLARADQQHFLFGEARKYPAREPHRGGGHRDDVGADSGVAAYLLRYRKRALKEFVEERSERAGRLGDASRLLHLAQDLRFADHHGVEAGGDAERVAYGFAVGEGVEIGLQLLWLDAVVAGEPLERGLRFAQRAVELGAIAGRKDCNFLDRFAQSQFRKRRSKALGLKHHSLADRERSGLVVQSEGEKLHGESGLRNLPL